MNPFQSFRFFDGMRLPHLGLLMKCALETNYRAGECLFTKGDPALGCFLIRSGSVALRDGGANGTTVASAGEILGGPGLPSLRTWAYSARALAPTRVTVLSGALLCACAKAHPDFGLELRTRAERLRLEESRRAEEWEISAGVRFAPNRLLELV